MTYQQALAYIHRLPRISSPEAMRELLRRLGDPHKQLKAVHIAGTNGKGSTAALIASMLRAAGYRTGLTVSPFILEFRERVQIDGAMIPPDALATLTEELCLHAEAAGVGEFAFITALAFTWFARQNCDICVVEVGLGGRLDATNLLERPLLSVITHIGLDHTDLLGDTIEQIAREKCGIIKPEVLTLTCAGQELDAFAVILEEACTHGNGTVIQPSRNAAQNLQMTLTGSTFDYSGLHIRLPLAGAYQIDNALTALAAAEHLCDRGYPRLTPEAMVQGIAAVRFPARFELMQAQPPILIDGAHNPQGMAALAASLSLLGDAPVTGVAGMLADKDSAAALAEIAPYLRRLICVTPENPRALAAHALAARADALGLTASAAHGLDEALELAQAVAASENGAVVVFGSLYLAAAARPLLQNTENNG